MGQKDIMTQQLFPDEQGRLFEKSYQEQLEEERNHPVECLGMTFPNDEARRTYFLDILREKLRDPEFRKIEGFPIGSDEDILALSDPPYYTACPNPFIGDFIKHYGKPYDPNVPYSREPFAVDISEGKTDPIYKAHSYHTKVPHLAIIPSILHYTEPGDVVLDGFCGSGMTGVAAQMCGNQSVVESLGFRLDTDGTILRQESDENGKPIWQSFSKLGMRRVVLNDLSPAAAFIASNYNLPFDVDAFAAAGRRILKEVDQQLSWMYETLHSDGRTKGRIEYTVWSEVFSCPDCAGEIVFAQEAFDASANRVSKDITCPHCSATAKRKEDLDLLFDTSFDSLTNENVQTPKRVPVLISYRLGKRQYVKQPGDGDMAILDRIRSMPLPQGIPSWPVPDMQMSRVGRMRTTRVTHFHLLFIPRAIHALSFMWRAALEQKDVRLRNMLLFFVEQGLWTGSVCNSYRPAGYSQVSQYMKGVYYVPSQHAELSPWYIHEGKLKRLTTAFSKRYSRLNAAICETSSTTNLSLPACSIDYVFTDPPFGENIYYADLNMMFETWYRVLTNTKHEAIIDRVRKKGLPEYQMLMQQCFREYYRVLKPGRWMTVVFHNSKNSVWVSIQEALQYAGFVIGDVRTLDKQQGSFQQVSSAGAVKQDLIISAYKPNDGLEERFKLEAGSEYGLWDFVRAHLRQLPVFVSKDGQGEVVAERQNYLLFDRMVAFHVQRGVTVPLSAAEFYAGLAQRFSERDGMYFLSDQVAEFDKKRMTVQEILQLQLFVSDESSAIQWLRQQLLKKPQTAGELNPQFMQAMQESGGWQKTERLLELDELLDQSFLRYDGKGEVPSQVHSYLSTNFKELRNLPKDDETLRVKGKDRWYVPDPNKAGDLEKLREKSLLKEFEEYRTSGQKRLKVFRLEAVRAGFKKAWQERDYGTIIAVARRMPEDVLQEDPKLLMWYDQAVTRAGDSG